MPRDYTTGQVAKIAGVSTRTAAKWFDSGNLKGYRIPGSRDRRIPLGDLRKFFKVNGLPMQRLEQVTLLHVLWVGYDEPRLLLQEIVDGDRVRLRHTGSPFEAGVMAVEVRPDVLVVDLGVGESVAGEILNSLRFNNDLSGCHTIGIECEDHTTGLRFSDHYRRPYDHVEIAKRLRELAEEKFRN